MKRVILMVTMVTMLLCGTCYANDGDGWQVFYKPNYDIATDVPRLPFSNLERIYINYFDVNDLDRLSNLSPIDNNMSYTIHGEEHGDVVIHVNTNKTLEILAIAGKTIEKFALPEDTKETTPEMTDAKWDLMKQQEIDIGFTDRMVLLSKGDPDHISTVRGQYGTMDILWYYWGHVVLVNDHVTEIDT